MAGNLAQVRNIAEVTKVAANGDLEEDHRRCQRRFDLKDTINVMVDQLSLVCLGSNAVAREVGTEGKLLGTFAQSVARGRILLGRSTRWRVT